MSGSRYNIILETIEELSREELAHIPSTLWAITIDGCTLDQKMEIILRKNIKIFGGVDRYINNMFDRNHLERIMALPLAERRTARDGTIFTFTPFFI